jgi:hypothetical protein
LPSSNYRLGDGRDLDHIGSKIVADVEALHCVTGKLTFVVNVLPDIVD